MEKRNKDIRVFGIAMAVVLGALGAWQLYRGRKTAGTILLALAGYFLVGGVAFLPLIAPLYGPWMLFGKVMGYVMTRLILTVFFFLVLTPLGLVRKLLGKDGLDRRLAADQASYYCEREKKAVDPARYERQF